ncbi:MAG TPA: MIP family channel protein [Nocardioides sp.]|nr:MIP family channel protein [Nocardioides sp.]
MADADAPPTQVQKLGTEAIGTFVLVLIGCGVAVTSDSDLVATGLAFGLTITFMVYALGRISGGHFNPAVSIGAAIGGRVSWRDAGMYIGAQFVGAILGALVLMILALGIDGFEAFDSNFPLGTNGYSEGPYDYAVWAALLVELVMTALFVFVILSVTDARNEHPALAPLAIGFTLAMIHFMLIPLTGTSVNPARSLGPALFSGGDWIVQVWPFIIAPVIGGALAGLAYPALFGHGTEPVAGSGFNFGAQAGAAPGYGTDQYQQQWNQPVAGDQPDQAGGYAAPDPAAGYAAPDPSAGYAAPDPSAGAHAAPQAEQPIIQDGWQWDPQAQQWIPAQQPPPQQQAPGQHGWPPEGGSEATQVRPPDA